MSDSTISSRITRLNQLLSGKTTGKKVPLIDKETLLDAFVNLYYECNTEQMIKDKNIATFVHKFKPLVCEVEKLRLKKSDFEIKKTIGRGHFGEVHVVREKVTGNVYAMKVLKKSETLSQDNVAFFEEERDIMAFANNPWITSLQYAFQDFENLFLVMDFHPGGDLLSLLAKYDDIFEENIAQFYLSEMVMAMHAVHALGYVHRDIKPENVLIDRLGHIKLADFGSSAKLSSAKMVVSKMPVGTPEYISPEVLMSMDGSGGGQGNRYGIECDWWSLGVVAYEMMVGNTPFSADSVVVVYSQIMNFKNSLTFPDDEDDDEPLSDNAKDLIRGLLTDQKHRLGYTDLAKHPFFNGLDWTTLQDAVPPYVPNIHREDDTSNFDDFETEGSGGPRLEDFMAQKKGFQGKDLPFIGFTFTKQLTQASQNEIMESTNTPAREGTMKRTATKRDSTKDPSNNSQQLIVIKVDLEKEQKKNKELKQQLEDKCKIVIKLENERDVLENEKALFDTEKKDVQRRLDSERANRLKAENEALALLQEIKEGNKKAEELRGEQLKTSNEHQTRQINQLENEKSAMAKKVQHLEEELEEHKKMVDDSKNKISDLQSKLTKVNEDTKTNVSELQSKLQKVTADSENRIKAVQNKLVKATAQAQEELSKIEKENEELKEQLLELKNYKENSRAKEEELQSSNSEATQSLEGKLKKEREFTATLKQDLKASQGELEDSRKRYDKLVEFGEDLKDQVERKIEKLMKDLSSSKRDYKKLEAEHQKLKEINEDSNNNLVSKESTIASLQASCASLEKQINELSTDSDNYTMKETEQRNELTRRLSQLSASKMVAENELNTLKQNLQDETRKMKEEYDDLSKQYDESTESYESTISKLNRDLTKAIDETNNYQKDLAAANKSSASMKNQISKLEAEIQTQKDKLEKQTQLKAKNDEGKDKRTQVEIENLKMDKKELEVKLSKANEELGKASKEKEILQEEANKQERQAESHDLTIQMLKQTCTMLEGQVEELEVANDEYQDRENQWNEVKRQHRQGLEVLEQQLTDALNAAEEHRQQKAKVEEKLRTIEGDASIKPDVQKKLDQLEDLNNSLEIQLQDMTNSLSQAEKNYGLTMVTIKSLERKIAAEIEEKEKLAAEISNLEDLSAQQTKSNFSLTVEIEALKTENEEIQAEKEVLQNQLERTAFENAEAKIKMESTLAQQTKLIDFLQDKNQPAAATKKTSKFFSGKPKTSHTEVAPRVVDNKKTNALERALEKEKNANLKLHLQLKHASDETVSVRNELQTLKERMRTSGTAPGTPRLEHQQMRSTASTVSLISKVSNSPSTSVADIYQQAVNEARGNQIMQAPVETNPNNKPHSLHHTLSMRPSKCPVCLNTVLFARQVAKCSECNMVCHSKCENSLQANCGLPKQQQMSASLRMSRSSLIMDDGTVAIDLTDSAGPRLPKLEGWLKFPRKSVKQGWERKWIVLDKMKLMIYDNENTIEFEPVDEIDLDITDGELNIHPAIPNSELIWSASTELVYVFAVELLPYTLGMMRRNLYFLAPTFTDKQKWVAHFDHISNHVRRRTNKDVHGLGDDVIMTLHGIKRVDINCAVMLSDTGYIFGCEDGLYVVNIQPGGDDRLNKPVPIVGLGPVHQLQLVKGLDIAVLIAGKERLFCTIDVKDLQNRLKQLKTGSLISAISSHQIEKVKNCHLFTIAKLSWTVRDEEDNYRIEQEYYACASSGHKLNILKYNPNTQVFILKKEIETTDPCTSLQLNSNSVIYGTSKFYTVDLRNYQRRDFLDASDTSLAFAVYGTSQSHTSPVAVFKISENKPREEFLLCFSEFGVFVDWQGRRSRKGDLKWSRLPLAFEYRHPFLYITHFTSVEICEISTDIKSDISTTPRRFIDVPEPRLIGNSSHDHTMFITSNQTHKLELISYRATPTLNNGVSRKTSAMSAGSVASAIIDSSHTLSPIIQRSGSSQSICSDEETSLAIHNQQGGHKDSKSHLRLHESNKDNKRYSFRFFKGSRKSQYDS